MQVLRVRSCLAGSNARSVLKDGDILLTVAGHAVSHFQAVEAAVARSRADQAAPRPAVCSTMPGMASSGDLGDANSEASSSCAHSSPSFTHVCAVRCEPRACRACAMSCCTERHRGKRLCSTAIALCCPA